MCFQGKQEFFPFVSYWEDLYLLVCYIRRNTFSQNATSHIKNITNITESNLWLLNRCGTWTTTNRFSDSISDPRWRSRKYLESKEQASGVWGLGFTVLLITCEGKVRGVMMVAVTPPTEFSAVLGGGGESLRQDLPSSQTWYGGRAERCGFSALAVMYNVERSSDPKAFSCVNTA